MEAASPPTDRLSQRLLTKFPDSKVVRNLRQAGALAPDENAIVGVPLAKVSPAIALTAVAGVLPAVILALAVQRGCYVVVTDRHVLVTRLTFGGRKGEGALKLSRPVHLALTETPKRAHTFGNKVRLPQEIAAFLGRPTMYATAGLLSDYAFQVARTPPAPAAPSS